MSQKQTRGPKELGTVHKRDPKIIPQNLSKVQRPSNKRKKKKVEGT